MDTDTLQDCRLIFGKIVGHHDKAIHTILKFFVGNVYGICSWEKLLTASNQNRRRDLVYGIFNPTRPDWNHHATEGEQIRSHNGFF